MVVRRGRDPFQPPEWQKVQAVDVESGRILPQRRSHVSISANAENRNLGRCSANRRWRINWWYTACLLVLVSVVLWAANSTLPFGIVPHPLLCQQVPAWAPPLASLVCLPR